MCVRIPQLTYEYWPVSLLRIAALMYTEPQSSSIPTLIAVEAKIPELGAAPYRIPQPAGVTETRYGQRISHQYKPSTKHPCNLVMIRRIRCNRIRTYVITYTCNSLMSGSW